MQDFLTAQQALDLIAIMLASNTESTHDNECPQSFDYTDRSELLALEKEIREGPENLAGS